MNIWNVEFVDLLNSFVDLLFPRSCSGCGRKLLQSEVEICLHCISDLPRCKFSCPVDNLMAKQFWGRIDCELMIAFCFYSKRTSFASMLQALKYGDRPKTGFQLGQQFATEQYSLIKSSKQDFIIPVPIHRSKLKKRGYNQSEYIAQGLSEVLEIPVLKDKLIRVEKGKSQTRKSRWLRSVEIANAFKFLSGKSTANVHYMLVDDVFTTGATAESCTNAILEEPGARVSVLTLGFAWS